MKSSQQVILITIVVVLRDTDSFGGHCNDASGGVCGRGTCSCGIWLWYVWLWWCLSYITERRVCGTREHLVSNSYNTLQT